MTLSRRSVLGLAGVLAGLTTSNTACTPGGTEPAPGPAEVARGSVGSEKVALLTQDAEVGAVFARERLRLDVTASGSRLMVAPPDRLAGHSFAFPGSAFLADRIRRETGATRVHTAFTSPMAIASFGIIVDLLSREGITRQARGGHWVFDLPVYLEKVAAGLRFDRIAGNSTYPERRAVLVTTTHPAYSNSAAMYAAMASHALLGRPVRDAADVAAVRGRVADLFVKQGSLDPSSADPFRAYLVGGVDAAPLVLIYEAQFLEAALDRHPRLGSDRVLVYPEPTVLSTHTVVALDDRGDKVGRLLATDPDLQRRAARHGFRPATMPDAVAQAVAGLPIAVPGRPTGVVEVPATGPFETLMTDVVQAYEG
jgi:hypothetical protein